MGGIVDVISDLLARVQDYLGNGGLFNPEMMDHDKVQRLIMDLSADRDRLREEIAAKDAEIQRLKKLIGAEAYD